MKTVNTVIANIIRIIRFSHEKNEKVIYQYWKVGQELSSAYKVNKFGSDFMNAISIGLKRKDVENKAYNRRGLYRMLQFYKAYQDWEEYGICLVEINWSCHILLLDCIDQNNREFWIEYCANRIYSVRKLKEIIKKWKAGILYRPRGTIELIQVNDVENDKAHKKCTINGNTYLIPTPEEFERMRNIDFRTLKNDELVDLREVEVKNVTSALEYFCSYLDQIKNPFCYKVGDMNVKVECDEIGFLLEEILENMIRRDKIKI